MVLQLRVLGPFQAFRDGSPTAVGAKKARALLAYLALPTGRRHHREHLASLLWSDTGEDRARHNLRQCLSTLRRAVGEDAILNEGELIYAHPDVVSTDAGDFARLAGEATSDALSRASELYRGDLLEDLVLREDPFVEWLAAERDRLRTSAASVRSRLAAALRGRDPERAITMARQQLTLDPANEQTHRLLMELFDAQGRRDAALRQYASCREALQRQLGVEPDAATRRLADSIRRGAADDDSACTRPPQPPMEQRTALPLPNRPSIAVLPFKNLAGSDEDYFSDGITEDITIALSKFGSLFVIARDSAFFYREHGLDPRRVSEELGVHYIVRGTVRRAGSQLRITAELVDAQTATYVWAHRYDRPLTEVFAVQSEVAQEIVATLASRVEAARLSRVKREPTQVLEAYDCVLRAKDLHHRWTVDDNLRAVEMLERAIELDPDYALAHAWLGCVLGQKHYFNADPALLPRAMELMARARELDDAESECHRVFASYHAMRKQLDQAMLAQERALELNPNDDRIVCQMGEILLWQGQPAEAERWVRRALRLNPYHAREFWYPLGQALYHQARPMDAVEALQRISNIRLRPRAYMAAAAARADLPGGASRHADLLRAAQPDFCASAFAETLPFAKTIHRQELVDGLVAAGLPE